MKRLFILLLLWHGVAFANEADLWRGLDLYAGGNYTEAYEVLLPFAEDNRNVQYVIGTMHSKGRGDFPKDIAKAIEWWNKAAEQGNHKAQLALGKLYYDGVDVPADYATAFHWYSGAAEKNNGEAQYRLAVMYEEGRGVVADQAASSQWYYRAAQSGFAQAQLTVAERFYEGVKGYPRDRAKAAEWYFNAAEQNVAVAQGRLGKMYLDGDGVRQSIRKAYEWTEKGAKQGNAEAQYNFAGALSASADPDFGLGTKTLASVWMFISAENGYEPAIKNVEYTKKFPLISDSYIAEIDRAAKQCIASGYERCSVDDLF